MSSVLRVVVMGVAGSGKSTFGNQLANACAAQFCDGDDLHHAAARAKMQRGEPLDDADRAPWLLRIRAYLQDQVRLVVACSALRESYRRQLAQGDPQVRFLWLQVSEDLARQRVQSRSHWFPPELVASQFASLELPQNDAPYRWLALDAAQPIAALIVQAMTWLR